MVGEGEFPKGDGDVLYASDVELLRKRLLLAYTGTDLDFYAAQSNTTANETRTHTLSLTSEDLSGRDAIYINMDSLFGAKATASDSEGQARVWVKLDNTLPSTNESILAEYKVCETVSRHDDDITIDKTHNFNIYYELTEFDKANGLDLLFTTRGQAVDTYSASAYCEFANRQILIWGV